MGMWTRTVRSSVKKTEVREQGCRGGSFGGRGRTVTGSALSGGKRKR
jgi:hypothetical protein